MKSPDKYSTSINILHLTKSNFLKPVPSMPLTQKQ